MLILGGEFGRVRLGGGPRESGVYWIDDDCCWNKFDPSEPNGPKNQNFDNSLRYRKIAYSLMGMIRVSIDRDARCVDIRWDVRAVVPASLDTLCEFIEFFCRGFTITFRFKIDAWQNEQFSHPYVANNRIQVLKSFQRVQLIDKFFLKSQSLGGATSRTNLVDKCIRAFEKADGHLDHPDFQELMPYLLVYKPFEAEDRMITAHAGVHSANAKVYGSSWARSANGGFYDRETPGVYYSLRASEAYMDVMCKDEPRLDQIRAIMELPNDEPVWASYQRFLFCGSLSDGTPILVCLSELNKGVDIPFLVP